MNSDETQLLPVEDNENTCVTATLVFKENKDITPVNTVTDIEVSSPSIIRVKEKHHVNASCEFSSHCLKLIKEDSEPFIFPLVIGLNKIGRSNLNNICILDKVY